MSAQSINIEAEVHISEDCVQATSANPITVPINNEAYIAYLDALIAEAGTKTVTSANVVQERKELTPDELARIRQLEEDAS